MLSTALSAMIKRYTWVPYLKLFIYKQIISMLCDTYQAKVKQMGHENSGKGHLIQTSNPDMKTKEMKNTPIS